jgi:hypothetical protein
MDVERFDFEFSDVTFYLLRPVRVKKYQHKSERVDPACNPLQLKTFGEDAMDQNTINLLLGWLITISRLIGQEMDLVAGGY